MFELNGYYRLKNANGDSLALSAFNGNSSFVVWKKDSKGRPAIKIKVSTIFAREIAKKLKGLAEGASAEGRVPLVIQKYNPDTKHFDVDSSICLVRDDKNIYSIELSGNGTGAKFEIRASQVFSDGSNPVSKEIRSMQGVRELIDVLTVQLPQANLLSTYGARGSGAGNGGGKQDPFANKTSSGNTDMSSSTDDDSLF